MELKGFGAFNDPKGNIKIASKFALAKEINKGWFDRSWIWNHWSKWNARKACRWSLYNAWA
jgi:hypothetical protein